MAWVAVAAMVVGTALQYSSQRKAGKAEQQRAQREDVATEYEARQLEQQSGQAFAIAQRTALEEQRKTRILQSRALALAAASGGGASDPTVVKIMSDIGGEGAYRAQMALYEGKEQQRSLLKGAEARRLGGTMVAQSALDRAKAYQTASTGTLFQGAGSLYQRYAANNPAPSAHTNTVSLSNGSWLDSGTPMDSTYA